MRFAPVAGRLGDIFGQTTVHAWHADFTIASGLCGFHRGLFDHIAFSGVNMLIAARVLQGSARAMMMPQSLSLCGRVPTRKARDGDGNLGAVWSASAQ